MTRKISYKKLWKLLIDRDMTKTALRDRTGISTVSLAKLGILEVDGGLPNTGFVYGVTGDKTENTKQGKQER